jgi:hypothetical protein
MKNIARWLVLIVLVFGALVRLTAYGDLRLTVANSLTGSYINSSNVNLLSWDAFTSFRPYTTNLLFQAFKPDGGYKIRAYADAIAGTTRRNISAGFDDIAVFQTILSVIGWTFLAWVFTSRIQNGAVKVLSAALIIAFGFTPQLADWDSVMGAESLSISLFMLAFGLLIWLAFAFMEKPGTNRANVVGFSLFFVTAFFWTFVRDVNAYPILFTGILIGALYIIPRFRRTKAPLVASLLLLALFVLGYVSARQRGPIMMTLKQVWASDIVNSPARLSFFTQRGMPEFDSPEFSPWLAEHGPQLYMLFLLSHPGYTTQNFLEDMNFAFTENLQPYFRANDIPSRAGLILLGDYLHPRDGAIFGIIVILLGIVWIPVLFRKDASLLPWAWALTVAFLTASTTMFFSVFGDVIGLHRHTLSSVATYRLLMWMLILVFSDYALRQKEEPTGPASLPAKSKQ